MRCTLFIKESNRTKRSIPATEKTLLRGKEESQTRDSPGML